MAIVLNVVLSATLISLALWIAKWNPILSGFIVSLPLSTLITLAMNSSQNSQSSSIVLAKSIFIGIPATLVFFIPFLFSSKFGLSFWSCYALGLLMLTGSFFAHRYLVSLLI